MKPIDSYFVRKRKASGIATSPTSPDHEPADKIVKCFNEGELSYDIGSLPLSRTASEPALLDIENVAAPSDVSAIVDTSDVASVLKCSFVIILNKEQRDWIYYIGLYYTTVI